MAEQRLPHEQPGCRSIFVRLIFRPAFRWSSHRPIRLVITFARPKKQENSSEQNSFVGDERESL
jgi:hypothetical protein